MADSAPRAVFLPKKKVFKPKPRPEMPYIEAREKKKKREGEKG